MKNHSRHTPFRMYVVALFFVLAWRRVFMTNSLPAKTARKHRANRNFWKAAAILKPVGRELGLRGVMDFDRHFDRGLSIGDKVYETQKRNKKPSLMWILWPSDLRKWKTSGVWHLQTADCRPQTADCKLEDTKNLPNKGDTIKSITSCEVRK